MVLKGFSCSLDHVWGRQSGALIARGGAGPHPGGTDGADGFGSIGAEGSPGKAAATRLAAPPGRDSGNVLGIPRALGAGRRGRKNLLGGPLTLLPCARVLTLPSPKEASPGRDSPLMFLGCSSNRTDQQASLCQTAGHSCALRSAFCGALRTAAPGPAHAGPCPPLHVESPRGPGGRLWGTSVSMIYSGN